MKKIIIFTLLSLIFYSCTKEKAIQAFEIIQEEYDDGLTTEINLQIYEKFQDNNDVLSEEIDLQIFKKFQEEYDDGLSPIGTYFWNEFRDYEQHFNLSKNENKLLGSWINMSIVSGKQYNSYAFFPNKFFILSFKYRNYNIIASENLYFNKAFGTWEIVDNIIQITIFSIMTEDSNKRYTNNKDIFLIEQPYTINIININDICEDGFTKRSINDTILSNKLQQMVTIKEPQETNNLYARKVYIYSPLETDPISGGLLKLYGYFTYFPEMAENNHSGLDIATNPELIKKYIPDWMI